MRLTSSQAVSSGGLREWMNQNSAVATVGAVAILAIALTILYFQTGGPTVKLSDSAWYAEPGTENLVVDKVGLIPPIDKDGKKLVLVHYFGCDGCGEKFIGYYEKYTDAGKKEMERLQASMTPGAEVDEEIEMKMYDITMTQRLYSTDGVKWINSESDQGQAVMEKIAEKCVGKKLAKCYP